MPMSPIMAGRLSKFSVEDGSSEGSVTGGTFAPIQNASNFAVMHSSSEEYSLRTQVVDDQSLGGLGV